VSDDEFPGLQAEFDRLDALLQQSVSRADRAAAKSSIVALFKRTEAAITDLAAFKERIRELVDRFKALPRDGAPASARYDHIGASTHVERGWSALATGDWAMAQTELRHAIALDPTSTTAEALLGWALMYQNRNDEALQLCLQVLLREPEQGLARVAVGAVCLRKGILGEAIEHLSRAAARTTDARAALYANFWLGVAYLEREMHGDAVEFLRRAVTQGPNLAEGWAELGRALWLKGQHPAAREAWMAGAVIRHSPHAVRCRQLLDIVADGGTPPRLSFA
jgi:tetratricopeptide (TPR) repeat protein